MNPDSLQQELETLHEASFAWAVHCCRSDRTEAEEVLQKAYVKVLSERARFRGDSALRTWFFGIIRLTTLEHFRQLKSHSERLRALPDALPATTGATATSDPRLGELRRLLCELSERQRETLHLVFEEEMTVEEAAQVMGITAGSARQHYHRAKQRLRSLFEKNHERV